MVSEASKAKVTLQEILLIMTVVSMLSAGLLSLCRAPLTQLLLVVGEPALFGYKQISVKKAFLLLQGPAAALLMLDCTAKLGEPSGRARLSTLGAAMLSTVMRFDKVDSHGR